MLIKKRTRASKILSSDSTQITKTNTLIEVWYESADKTLMPYVIEELLSRNGSEYNIWCVQIDYRKYNQITLDVMSFRTEASDWKTESAHVFCLKYMNAFDTDENYSNINGKDRIRIVLPSNFFDINIVKILQVIFQK